MRQLSRIQLYVNVVAISWRVDSDISVYSSQVQTLTENQQYIDLENILFIKEHWEKNPKYEVWLLTLIIILAIQHIRTLKYGAP